MQHLLKDPKDLSANLNEITLEHIYYFDFDLLQVSILELKSRMNFFSSNTCLVFIQGVTWSNIWRYSDKAPT